MITRALLVLGLVIAGARSPLCAQGTLRLDGPGLTVRYTDELKDAAIRCVNLYSEVRERAERLVGRPLRAPILVELVRSNADLIARTKELGYERTPEWAGGIALAPHRTAILVIAHRQALDWSLPALLAHEVAHLVVADRMGDREAPRWLDEGVAKLAEGYVREPLWIRLPVRAFFGWLYPLSELEAEFEREGELGPLLAYVQAESFTYFLERTIPDGRLSWVFDHLARGDSVEQALFAATSIRLTDLEAMWHAELRRDRSWMPWLFSQIGFGAVVLGMVGLIWPRSRKRRREQALRMAAEDEASPAEEDEDFLGWPEGKNLRRLTGLEVRRLEEGEDDPRV